MKKKLALLMAAIMTVAMVPMTAFAATAGGASIAADYMKVGVNSDFVSVVELYKKSANTWGDTQDYVVEINLENGEFSTYGKNDDYTVTAQNETDGLGKDGAAVEEGQVLKYRDEYVNDWNPTDAGTANHQLDYHVNTHEIYNTYDPANPDRNIVDFEVISPTRAKVTIAATSYANSSSTNPILIPIAAKATSAGDVYAKFESLTSAVFIGEEAIAVAVDGDVSIESAGVRTFVEDQSKREDTVKKITLTEAVIGSLSANSEIEVTLKGNYELVPASSNVTISDENSKFGAGEVTVTNLTTDGFTIELGDYNAQASKGARAYIVLDGLVIKPTKSCDVDDVATLTFKSDANDFSSVKLEVAKMVAEAVTYTVEDDDLPRLWAGQLPQNNDDNDGESLSIFIEENTGDILNTTRKATFTFPEGIEVVDIAELDGVVGDNDPLVEGQTYADYHFEYEIDENVVTIWNYGEDEESEATDMEISFILSAAPTFSGDVEVTLGGEFDDVSFKVATVKAPYTVEAKTSEVLIDYRYVPVNDIVITEAEEGLLDDGDVIMLQVEKMDFEDAGSFEVTSGDIDVDVTIEDGVDDRAQLAIEVKDSSTEASTITISGLELYLDRTLPVGGYALENVMTFTNLNAPAHTNILWENSSDIKGDEDAATYGYDYKGIFKYSAVTVNDSYVEVVTAGRDQDDSSTTRKIVITIGATTMAVGTETVTLDAPAYINSDNYTMLPLRAVSEAFGATVGWDDASRTVTLMMGQRIVSMTIGSKTMYINGTPVAMNTAPEITNERTFVPVRDLANALGITKIDWNEASATVTLN